MNPLAGPCRVSVRRLGDHYLVVATMDVAVGEVLLVVTGISTDRPSRETIQVGPHEHLEPPRSDPDHHPWRYLNHSCAPNARLDGRLLRATQPIACQQEITFDYNTNEFDMASPFPCTCGTAACLGLIRGYRHLTSAQRFRLGEGIAEHLRTLTAADPC